MMTWRPCPLGGAAKHPRHSIWYLALLLFCTPRLTLNNWTRYRLKVMAIRDQGVARWYEILQVSSPLDNPLITNTLIVNSLFANPLIAKLLFANSLITPLIAKPLFVNFLSDFLIANPLVANLRIDPLYESPINPSIANPLYAYNA